MGTCHDQTIFCCQATQYQKSSVQCIMFTLELLVPSRCECQLCSKQEIAVSGKVVNIDETIPMKLGHVYRNGIRVAFTDFQGNFKLWIKMGTHRLALTFKDSLFREFIEDTYVLHIHSTSDLVNHIFHLPLIKQTTVLHMKRSIFSFEGHSHIKVMFDKTVSSPKSIFILDQSIQHSHRLNPGSYMINQNGFEVPFDAHFMAAILIDGQIVHKVKDLVSIEVNIPIAKGKVIIPSPMVLQMNSMDGYWYEVLQKIEISHDFVTINATLDRAGWLAVAFPTKSCFTKIKGNNIHDPWDFHILQKPSGFTGTWTSIKHMIMSNSEDHCILTSCDLILVRSGSTVTHYQTVTVMSKKDDRETRDNAIQTCREKHLASNSNLSDKNKGPRFVYLEETSYKHLLSLSPENLYMAWYPLAYKRVYKACFLKIKVICPGKNVLRLYSFGGTHNITKERMYGLTLGETYTPGINICLEYKCSGLLYTQYITDIDITLLELNLDGSDHCFMSSDTNKLYDKIESDTPGYIQAVKALQYKMYVPLDCYGPSYGLYTDTSTYSAADARRKAKHQCDNSQILFTDEGDHNDEYKKYNGDGVAIIFDEPHVTINLNINV